MPAAYPSNTELVEFFQANGFPALDPDEATSLITSAIAEFENLTIHRPFLTAAVTKTFDVELSQSNDGYRLLIEEDPCMANVAIVHRSLADVETTLVAGTDFDMLPLSAGVHLNPHFIVRFRNHLGDGFVDITAPFGYATSIPQDVWDAVMDYAVQLKLSRMAKLSSFNSGGNDITKLRQGPVEFTYASAQQGSSTSGSLLSEARALLGEVAKRYR